MDFWLSLLVPCFLLLPLISIVSNTIIIIIPYQHKTMRENIHQLLALFCFTQILHSYCLVGLLFSIIFEVKVLKQVECLLIQAIPLLGTFSQAPILLAISIDVFLQSINSLKSFANKNARLFFFLVIVLCLVCIIALFISILNNISFTQPAYICSYWSALDLQSEHIHYSISIVINIINTILTLISAYLVRTQRDSSLNKIAPGIFFILFMYISVQTLSILGKFITNKVDNSLNIRKYIRLYSDVPFLWSSCATLFILYHYSSSYNKSIKKLLGRVADSKVETTLSFSRRRSTAITS